MSLKALPFLFVALTYLALGLWVTAQQKNKLQILYGILCITTCFWEGVWVAMFSHLPPASMIYALKWGYSGIVFIPPVFYHFLIEFTRREAHPKLLPITYLISFLLAISTWVDHLFIKGLNRYPWGIAARAGYLHPLFIILVAIVVIRMLLLLKRMIYDVSTPPLKKQQAIWVMTATLIYSCGTEDLLSNYGYPAFPLSFVFVGIALGLFCYAIFRYEFLALKTSNESEAERQKRQAASQELSRLGMTAAFPLVSQGELLGYLLLGEKRSEEAYSKEDVLLLRIVANQAALAYQRVRFLEMAVRGARTEMLGEIAGGFAHEIKTPLANISMPAEMTYLYLDEVEKGKRKFEEIAPELKQFMKDIMAQTLKASDKIEAIRQFSKPGDVQFEPVELPKVIHASLSLLDHSLRKSSIKLDLQMPDKLPLIRGNMKQLEIVFVNLIKNAAEALVGGNPSYLSRNLWIKVSEDSRYIKISIKDSGPGIRKTDIGHLFEAYFTTKGSSGTGMGLFLSHQVIKAHGGSINVLSEEGKGTEFIVHLPKLATEERTAA